MASGEVDGTVDQERADALLAASGAGAQAEQRPDLGVVHPREGVVARELGELVARGDRGPAHHLVPVVGQDAGRAPLAAQRLHAVALALDAELGGLRRAEAVGEAWPDAHRHRREETMCQSTFCWWSVAERQK